MELADDELIPDCIKKEGFPRQEKWNKMSDFHPAEKLLCSGCCSDDAPSAPVKKLSHRAGNQSEGCYTCLQGWEGWGDDWWKEGKEGRKEGREAERGEIISQSHWCFSLFFSLISSQLPTKRLCLESLISTSEESWDKKPNKTKTKSNNKWIGSAHQFCLVVVMMPLCVLMKVNNAIIMARWSPGERGDCLGDEH